MKFNWNQISGSVALSAMALSMIGTSGAVARNKSGPITPNPPSVAKGKSATIPVELPQPPSVEKGKSATIPVELPTVDAPVTEKGIKDNAIKSCGSCGVTGKEAAAPPVDDGAAPSSTERSTGGSVKSIPGIPPNFPRPNSKRVKTPKTGKTSLLLPVLGGVAALTATVVLVSSGGDNPVSP